MLFEDCARMYSISIEYEDGSITTCLDGTEISLPSGWYWSIDCGYEHYGAKDPSETAAMAEKKLRSFIKEWEGPEK